MTISEMLTQIVSVFIEYKALFFKGAIGTLKYAAIAVSLGSVLGTIVAFLNLSKNKVIAKIAEIYATIIRGTPLLVQMYLAYYFLPMYFKLFAVLSKEQCVLMSLIINSSAYVSEIVRGGIQSVDIGQSEAARSLGMSERNCMIKIILPQAIRTIIPSLANEYISMIKETSMAGSFQMYELMYTRTILANKFLMWQPLFIVAFMYLIMTYVLSKVVKLIEMRLAVSDR